MFLTKLEINPLRRQARQLLSDPQAMHAATRTCAPGDSERVLWRVDDTNAGVSLYMVTRNLPDMSDLNVTIGWHDQPAKTVDYSGLLNSLQNKDSYAFRITANPTHIVTQNGVKKRLGHVSVKYQTEWFLKKARSSGFVIREISTPNQQPTLDLVVHDRKTKVFPHKGRTTTIRTATFSGTLTVIDKESLKAALINGIGPAKAYGCGLLTLARLS